MLTPLRKTSGLSSGSDSGATAVEYALIIALISAAIIGTVLIFGGEVGDLYDSVIGKF